MFPYNLKTTEGFKCLMRKGYILNTLPSTFPVPHPGYYTTTESIHLYNAFLECIRNDNNC